MEAVSNGYINNPSHVLNHIPNTLIHSQLIIGDMLLGLWLKIRKPARSIELFKLTKSIFSLVICPRFVFFSSLFSIVMERCDAPVQMDLSGSC